MPSPHLVAGHQKTAHPRRFYASVSCTLTAEHKWGLGITSPQLWNLDCHGIIDDRHDAQQWIGILFGSTKEFRNPRGRRLVIVGYELGMSLCDHVFRNGHGR